MIWIQKFSETRKKRNQSDDGKLLITSVDEKEFCN